MVLNMTHQHNSSPYENQLYEIGILLGEPFKRAKDHHLLVCVHCNHQWTATPISKLQAFKKYGHNGCPKCNEQRIFNAQRLSRQRNIQSVLEKGLEILSNWDGRNAVGANCRPLLVRVRNTVCGHEFTSNAVNLLRTSVKCSVCGIAERAKKLTQTSLDRSEEWQKSAPEWKLYKSAVNKLTKQHYKQHKSKINPNNLPTGRAGTEGAYHIDHIVPIKYCYINQIPIELCAHPDNLQMLGWRENVGSRDKLKATVPNVFINYIKTQE